MTASDSPRSSRWRTWSPLIGQLLGFFAILLLFVGLVAWREGPARAGDFLSLSNLQVTLSNVSITAVLSLAMLLIIISGGIDLSVGSVAALVTVVAMKVYVLVYLASQSVALACLASLPAGVLIGGLCGLTNGLIITGLRVSPFVTTLGMMGMARGLALWLADGKPIGFPRGDKPEWFRLFTEPEQKILIFTLGFWTFVLLALGMAVLLRSLVLGRYAYAIGSSEATARLCGIPVERVRLQIYTLAGLLTGWAGVLSFAELGGNPSSNEGKELDVIAAVVIGGASLAGGQGTVSGTLIGVLILGLLLTGVGYLGMPEDYRKLLTGGVIILSVALGRWRSRDDS